MAMNDRQRQFWDRVAAFGLDEPDARLPFTDRLARENRWSRPFARRVAEEYRRFLFLAVEAGHPVTPSDQVDQAWHLHLTYTESYWGGLCRGVLGRPLHHGPTRGGEQEAAKFHDWYSRTLDSYRRLFGSEPPADVWPPAAERFGRDLHFARVNTQTHWVVPRPSTVLLALADRLRPGGTSDGAASPLSVRARGRRLALTSLAVLVAGSSVLFGCQAAGGQPPPVLRDLSSLSGGAFLGLYIPLAIGAAVVSVLLRLWAGTWGGGGADPQFVGSAGTVTDFSKIDPYALILLAQGPDRAAPVQAALARLVDQGRLTFDEATKRLTAVTMPPGLRMHPVEWAMYSTVQGRTPTRGRALVRAAARSDAVRELQQQLRARGWALPAGRALAARLLPIVPLAPVIALGLWRIVLGVERGRPVGYLVTLCVAVAVVAVIHFSARPWRTPRGQAVFDALKQRESALAGGSPAPSDPQFLRAFALLGLASLPATGILATLKQEILPPPSGGGGDGSCGGGDGGGGGGCGGCGGCGGGD